MALIFALLLWAIATISTLLFVFRVWWLPELASEPMRVIDDQFNLTIIVVGVAFFLAQVGLGWAIWRYRARGNERAAYWHESPKLEATWTVVTAVVFIGLGLRGNVVWSDLRRSEAPAGALQVEVTGQQFAWNFRYSGPDGTFGKTDPRAYDDAANNPIGLLNETGVRKLRRLGVKDVPVDPTTRDDMVVATMAVPVNRPVQVLLRSKDVTHAFFIPNMRVKQDAVPGLTIPLNFTPTKTGEYEIACAELCGMTHYRMKSKLQVLTEPEFEKWLKERQSQ
jgi:cytochrome c oxidase subunit 2